MPSKPFKLPTMEQMQTTILPVIIQQVKKVGPLIQQLSSALSATNRKKPEDFFPVNWDVDEKSTGEGSYKLKINVKDFPPDKVKVKVKSDSVIVEGDYKKTLVNKSDQSTVVSKYFITEFKLPEGASSTDVQSSMQDGVMIVSTTKKAPPATNKITTSSTVNQPHSSNVKKAASSTINQASPSTISQASSAINQASSSTINKAPKTMQNDAKQNVKRVM